MKNQKHRPYVEQPDPCSDEFVALSYRDDGTAYGVYKDVNRANAYQELAKTFAYSESFIQPKDRLTEYLMGLSGESGEAIDILKKHMFQGHDMDTKDLALELGDVAWYLAMAANALGYSLSDIFRMNIEKLIKRYPEGFDPERSVNRGGIDNIFHVGTDRTR